MNLQQKRAYENVFEVDLSRPQLSAKGGNLLSKSPMPAPKDSFGVCTDAANQVIYTIGGRDLSRKATTKCEKYCIATDTWSSLPDLPEARFSISCILHTSAGNPEILAMGGYDSQD